MASLKFIANASASSARDRAAAKAAKLNALLVRWGRLQAELQQLMADTPNRFFEWFPDAGEEIKTGMNGIQAVMASIGTEYGAAAGHAG